MEPAGASQAPRPAGAGKGGTLKKPEIRKLQLHKDTLRRLESVELESVIAGMPIGTYKTGCRTCTC
jgi:hypothetical protein